MIKIQGHADETWAPVADAFRSNFERSSELGAACALYVEGELVVVEDALKAILRDDEAPIWLYQAAKDYAERYDSRHGTGLIPSSAPMMQEIADFWREFYGIEG